MTIREMIIKYQNEISNENDLTPDRASEILVKLSALLGNIADEITRTEVAYNRVLLEKLNSETKANRAKILAETTSEYEEKLNARNTKEVAIELIRSLKYFLKAKEDEYRYSSNL